MTIDEIIKSSLKVAESDRYKADNEYKDYGLIREVYIKHAEEHEQIASLLEELKALKEGLNIKCDSLNEALKKGEKI